MVAWATNQVFSSRAAFVHVGAVIGSIMVANVFFIIIPNQKIVVADLVAGRKPDPSLGLEAKQRSTHNNYLTLPVLLMMISIHYPMVFGHEQSWLVVAFILVIGGIIRDFFNRMNAGATGGALFWQWPLAVLFMCGLIIFVSYDFGDSKKQLKEEVSFTQVMAITQKHCTSCHALRPSDPNYDKAPAGVRLENIEDLRKHGEKILKQAVLTKAMPLGNATLMKRKERDVLGSWILGGMPGFNN